MDSESYELMPSKEDYMLEYIRRDSYRSMRYLGDFSYVPLHVRWHEILKSTQKFILLAPRGHAKTTNILFFIAWLIGQLFETILIKLFCCNGREAQKRVETIGKIITSERYRKLFPHIKPDPNTWNKTQLRVLTHNIEKDPQLEGLGYESSWTGSRTNWLFADDVVDFESSLCLETQENYEKKFDADLDNILVPDAHLCYIATPWTISDLTARLQEKGILPVFQWDYRNYKEDEKLLWDDYWTKEKIEEKQEDNPLGWKQGFELIPLTSDLKRIFFREEFEFVEPLKPNGMRPCCAIDLATGSGKDNSSIAIGFDFRDYKYFHDIQIMDLKINDLLQKVNILDTMYNFHKIYFESNAFQKIFGDLLPLHLKLKSEGSHTSKAKKEDLNTGLKAFAAQIGNRKVKFNKNISEDVITEYVEYPFGKHDDSVMSGWICWENMCGFIERVCL